MDCDIGIVRCQCVIDDIIDESTRAQLREEEWWSGGVARSSQYHQSCATRDQKWESKDEAYEMESSDIGVMFITGGQIQGENLS